jgi:hypothetical protein
MAEFDQYKPSKASFAVWVIIGDWGVFWGATPFGQANGVAERILGNGLPRHRSQ